MAAKNEGRTAQKRTSKTPNDRPVSAAELDTAPDAATMSDAEIAQANEEGGGIIRSDEPEVDAAVVAERQKAEKKEARSEKRVAAARADLRDVLEKENPDALTIDDVADTSQTEAQQPFAFDIRPDFQTMDETGIREYLKHLTRWLRDRDAVVRGPELTEHEIDDTSVAEVTREGSSGAAGEGKKKTITVYEGFYEWQYADAPAITIRRTHVTGLDAFRDMANEAVVRRYEV